jgi:hypothetical protein
MNRNPKRAPDVPHDVREPSPGSLTGRLRAATLADMGRCRMGFALRAAGRKSVCGANLARERQQCRPSNREAVARDR